MTAARDEHLVHQDKRGWEVRVVHPSSGKPHVRVDSPEGDSDYPVRYDDGRLAFDRGGVPHHLYPHIHRAMDMLGKPGRSRGELDFAHDPRAVDYMEDPTRNSGSQVRCPECATPTIYDPRSELHNCPACKLRFQPENWYGEDADRRPMVTRDFTHDDARMQSLNAMHPIYATDNPFTDDNPFRGQNNPFGSGQANDQVPENPVGPETADQFQDAGVSNTPQTTKPRVIPGGANPADSSQPPGGVPPMQPVMTMPIAAPMATPSIGQGMGGTPNLTGGPK